MLSNPTPSFLFPLYYNRKNNSLWKAILESQTILHVQQFFSPPCNWRSISLFPDLYMKHDKKNSSPPEKKHA